MTRDYYATAPGDLDDARAALDDAPDLDDAADPSEPSDRLAHPPWWLRCSRRTR